MDPISQQLVMGAAGSGGSEKLYVEDVFSTWLYTGNESTQTITNGIDLSGKGGLVWIKSRSSSAAFYDHVFCDTVRGNTKYLASSGSLATSGQQTGSGGTNDITSFNSNGFSLGTDFAFYKNTGASTTYASWTFRKAAKFFDVVTYTGNGTNRTIAHSLGSVPGCIIVKRTDTTGDWYVYHRSLANTDFLYFNAFTGSQSGATVWNNTTPTTTSFSIGTSTGVNASGGTYIAYLFAHNAGGFGSTGADDVISCGSYTGNGSSTGPVVTLGWEPQWILLKRSDTSDDWVLCDTDRSLTLVSNAALYPYSSIAETFTSASRIDPTPTGFQLKSTTWNASGGNYIYIAIRRGPMKTPTDATKVFSLQKRTGTNSNTTISTNLVSADAFLSSAESIGYFCLSSRLCGPNTMLTLGNIAESSTAGLQAQPWDLMDGVKVTNTSPANINGQLVSYLHYFFRRAPGFFDIVSYAATGSTRTVSHALGSIPELMLVKSRTNNYDWQVYFGNPSEYIVLNSNAAKVTGNTDRWNNTSPTASVFTVGTSIPTNFTGTYIAYLFASCPGVSKVGTYSGTGATQQINCGFSSGARFVLIKRVDSAQHWFIWDTAQGIVSANDPYIPISENNYNKTNTDYIDPLASGFELTSAAGSVINASGGTYLYLAIA